MNKSTIATVVLLKDSNGRICLAPKKNKIHKNGEVLENSGKKWNGYGGKQLHGETVLETAIRELKDESGVQGEKEDLELMAKICFFWPGNETKESDMIVYFFFLSVFKGEPKEGEEMGMPKFFFPDDIPLFEMMPADRLFFPKILNDEKIVWNVYFGEKDNDGNPRCEDIGQVLNDDCV